MAAARVVAVGAVLTCALFPYLLAAAGGLVYGTVVGGIVSIAAGTTGAIAAFLIARRRGRGPVGDLAGERVRRVLDTVARRGFVAVPYARIAPGVPRGVANYAFGLTPVALAPYTAATALGTAPCAFAYVARNRRA